jgi:hypothetical protein
MTEFFNNPLDFHLRTQGGEKSTPPYTYPYLAETLISGRLWAPLLYCCGSH